MIEFSLRENYKKGNFAMMDKAMNGSKDMVKGLEERVEKLENEVVSLNERFSYVDSTITQFGQNMDKQSQLIAEFLDKVEGLSLKDAQNIKALIGSVAQVYVEYNTILKIIEMIADNMNEIAGKLKEYTKLRQTA